MGRLLDANDIHGGYGGADILRGCSVTVDDGEIVVIIGPNGAGKSTLMKAIMGLARVREGRIHLRESDITGLRPDRVVCRGVSYVPQERNVFATLSVQENLEVGAYLRDDDIRPRMAEMYELFPRLAERRGQAAGLMSGGERQMLAMARALMLSPELLLLDEPTAGLSPLLIDQTFARIRDIRDRMGIGILMVEQNARQALAAADRGLVLAMGRNRHEGSGGDLAADPEVAEMFLGG